MLSKYEILAIIIVTIILFVIIVLSSRNRIVKTYNKYMHINNQADLSGKQLAFFAKGKLGLSDLQFSLTKTKLGDAYSPKYKTLIISEEVCDTASLSSMAIIAHELGHALQHKDHSIMFTVSLIFAKLTRFTNKFIVPLLIIGIGMYAFGIPSQSTGAYLMISSGILFFLHFVSMLLNIPVEYDASSRAMKFLKENKLLSPSEMRKARHLLNIAAQTYVASILDSLFILKRK